MILGDGENAILNIGVKENNANYTIQSITWNKGIVEKSNDEHITIKDSEDYIEKEIMIDHVWAPSGVNWQTNIYWEVHSDSGDDDWFNLCRCDLHDGSVQTWYRGYYDERWNSLWFNDESNLVEDLNYKGKRISEYDFYNTAWFYCPGSPELSPRGHTVIRYSDYVNGVYSRGAYGHASRAYSDPYVMTDHVQYHYEPVIDTTVRAGSGSFGNIQVVIYHNGKPEKINFNVYREIRACTKTYR